MTARLPLVVAFDAVDTLIHPHPSVAEIYANVAREFGSVLSIDEVAERFGHAFRATGEEDAHTSPPWVTSEARERRRWRTIVDSVFGDLTETDELFVALHHAFGQPEHWRVFSEVPEVLGELERRGYRLVIASNFDERLHPLCDALPGLDSLEGRFVSSTIGYRKPSPHFFRAIVENSPATVSDVLMVGDRFENDIVPAHAIGMQTCLIDRTDETPRRSRTDNHTDAPTLVVHSLTELLDELPTLPDPL